MIPGKLLNGLRSAATRFPKRIALTEAISQQTISYEELIRRGEQLAAYLHSKKILPGARIAIIFPKCIDGVVVMLGSIFSGSTYIPIDPELPIERVKLLLRECDPHVLITHPDYFPSEIPCQQNFSSDSLNIRINAGISFFPTDTATQNPPLAILYTSGSTGKPKGVCLSETNIFSFVEWSIHTFSIKEKDHIASIAPFHFDLSLFDLYASLVSGSSVYLFDHTLVKNIKMLSQHLSRADISVVYATPSLLNLMLHYGHLDRYDFSKLRLVLFAGEIFPVKQLHQLMDKWESPSFYNLYGPTETNVCTSFLIPQKRDEHRTEPYPIGKVCSHLHGRISSEGELLISGGNVMMGYHNNDELNDAVFIEIEDERFYKTGDRVELNANGDLLFCGRFDRMLKRRGYRVEPGEIESTLASYPFLLECVVKGETLIDGSTIVTAHVCMSDPSKESILQIKQFCADHLPSYMIPDKIIFFKELPRTSSGKVDVNKL